jgi:hypothetical protein
MAGRWQTKRHLPWILREEMEKEGNVPNINTKNYLK